MHQKKLERSSAEKDLALLEDNKLSMSQQRALGGQEGQGNPGVH